MMSPTVAGVERIASMVPRSHSRATTRAVSRVPMMVMTTAMAPGTRKRWLSISGLNQKRGSNDNGGKTTLGRAASQPAKTPWA